MPHIVPNECKIFIIKIEKKNLKFLNFLDFLIYSKQNILHVRVNFNENHGENDES